MKENYPGFRITDLWVFVGIDSDDDEGVMAAPIGPGGSPLPLVAADRERKELLKPIAADLVRRIGGRYEIRHFVRADDGT